MIHINGITYAAPHQTFIFGPGASLDALNYQPQFLFHFGPVARDPSTMGGYSPDGPRPGAKRYTVRMSHLITGDPRRRGVEEGWKRDVIEPDESKTQSTPQKATLPICASCLRPLALGAVMSGSLPVDLTDSFDATRFGEPSKNVCLTVGRPWALRCGHVVCANCIFAAKDRMREKINFPEAYKASVAASRLMDETYEEIEDPDLPLASPSAAASSSSRSRTRRKPGGAGAGGSRKKAKGKVKEDEEEGGEGEVSVVDPAAGPSSERLQEASSTTTTTRKTRSSTNRQLPSQRGRPKGKGRKGQQQQQQPQRQSLPAAPYHLRPVDDAETDWFWTDCPVKDCDGAGTDLLADDLRGPWEIFV
jgi:hypothetical protein